MKLSMKIEKIKIGNDEFKMRLLSAWEYGLIEEETLNWDKGIPIPRVWQRDVKYLASSLVDWTLTDENGRKLEINEENIKKLPLTLFRALIQAFHKLHSPPTITEETMEDFLQTPKEQV